MSPRLGVRPEVRTTLRLNPAIQASLRVLQANQAELRIMVEQELSSNPLLEPIEESEPAEGPESGESEGEPDTPLALPDDVSCWEETGPMDREWRETASWEGWTASPPRFREFLIRQLRLSTNRPNMLRVGEYLIGCLDERGYLTGPLEQTAQELGAPLIEVEEGLRLLQGLEPPGVGARDLRECLLLQLAAGGEQGTNPWKIVEKCFDLLLRGKMTEIFRRLSISAPQGAAAVKRLRRLALRPASSAEGMPAPTIDPDLIVVKVGTEYEVSLNDHGVTRLRVNRPWPIAVGAGEDSRDLCSYLEERFRAARWFLAACDRRRVTILRVMRCILDEQKDFLERGVVCLKAMTQRDVAGRLGLHESTVARVTRGKYVQTPRGIYPLKYFFSNRVGRDRGKSPAARAVTERIRHLCREEDRLLPKTDEEIARVLRREGIEIARRTVAKYRAQLKITRASLRRGGNGFVSLPAESGALQGT